MAHGGIGMDLYHPSHGANTSAVDLLADLSAVVPDAAQSSPSLAIPREMREVWHGAGGCMGHERPACVPKKRPKRAAGLHLACL